MKKTITTVIILLTLCGCTYNETAVLNNTNSDVFGELNLQKSLKNLKYKTSSYWQFMDNNVTDETVGLFEQWHVSIITDYNLRIVCGFFADDELKSFTDSNYAEGYELIKGIMKEGGFGYSFVDTFNIDNRIGYLLDVSNDGISDRMFYLFDDGGYYLFDLSNGTNSIPSVGLDFMYDYVQTLSFSDPQVDNQQ